MAYSFTDEIQQRIDESLAHPDVREGLRGLIKTAIQLHAEERNISLLSVRLVGLLHERNGAGNSVLSREGFAWTIGLTPNCYWKRAQAYRVLKSYPEIARLVENGETAISHVAMLAPHITQANAAVLSTGMQGKSTRELKDFIAAVNPDGSMKPAAESFVEIKLRLSTADVQLIDRAQEVLGHSMRGPNGGLPTKEAVVISALKRLLEQQDPLRRAERAAAKKDRVAQIQSPAASQEDLQELPAAQQKAAGERETEKTCFRPAPKRRRTSIPNSLRHEVWLRDQGRCTHSLDAGQFCGSRYRIEIDHKVPWAKGGLHTLENLALKCRPHNQLAAEQAFGKEFMDRQRSVSFG